MIEKRQFLNKEIGIKEKMEGIEIDPTLKMLLSYRDEILAMLNGIKDEPELNNVFEQFRDGLDKLNAHIQIAENRLNAGEHKSDNQIPNEDISKAA